MFYMRPFAIPLIAALSFVGCATHGGMDAASYQLKMRRVDLGMQKQEFRAVFPEANARGAKAYPQGAVEVLEVMQGSYHFAPTNRPDVVRDGLSGTEYEPIWFYFYNGKLVQYGKPNDWPKDPDKVVEVRVR
jgi:hypothetical protein